MNECNDSFNWGNGTQVKTQTVVAEVKTPTVVVTGFGLFRDYKVNPSFECIKRLNIKDIKLIIEEIPVVYEEVDKRVTQIWNQYKPQLVIHCGVSSSAKCITLETRAVEHKTSYDKPDIFGRLPSRSSDHKNGSNEQKCQRLDSIDCNKCLKCEINLDKICDEVNHHFTNGSIRMGAVVSADAGRYLCEYIFSQSLRESTGRTAFIHVPDISQHFSMEDIESALELTIEILIKEVLNEM